MKLSYSGEALAQFVRATQLEAVGRRSINPSIGLSKLKEILQS